MAASLRTVLVALLLPLLAVHAASPALRSQLQPPTVPAAALGRVDSIVEQMLRRTTAGVAVVPTSSGVDAPSFLSEGDDSNDEDDAVYRGSISGEVDSSDDDESSDDLGSEADEESEESDDALDEDRRAKEYSILSDILNGNFSAPHNPYKCKEGHSCPDSMSHPACCKGGEVCCEYMCLNDFVPVQCPRTPTQILDDRLKFMKKSEASAKVWIPEARRKDAKESLEKQKLEEQEKSKTEQVVKARLTQTEQSAKRHHAQNENEVKRGIQAEQQSKEAEKKRLDQEQQVKRKPSELRLLRHIVPYGNDYRPPQYVQLGNLCILSGLMRIKAGISLRGDLAEPIDDECLPRGRLVFNTAVNHVYTARLDVLARGVIRHQAGSVNSRWVSLDGILFAKTGTVMKSFELAQPWVNYGKGGYVDANWYREGDVCVLGGLIRVTDWQPASWSRFIGTLPPSCRPKHRLVMNMNHNEYTHRVDILASGNLYWITGTKKRPWISLNGVAFSTADDTAIELLDGWKPYGSGLKSPGWFKQGSLIVLGGTVQGPGQKNRIGVLPPAARPAQRLIFACNNHQRSQRIDILPDGRIMWTDSSYYKRWRPKTWISLDNIHFTAP